MLCLAASDLRLAALSCLKEVTKGENGSPRSGGMVQAKQEEQDEQNEQERHEKQPE